MENLCFIQARSGRLIVISFQLTEITLIVLPKGELIMSRYKYYLYIHLIFVLVKLNYIGYNANNTYLCAAAYKRRL